MQKRRVFFDVINISRFLFFFIYYLQQHFSFLHSINTIVSIKSNPRITAKTITAGNAAKIAALTAAPIISPITVAKATNKITATSHKQFFFLLHLQACLHSYIVLS